MQIEIALLDYMAYRAGCACLSDLRTLTPVQRSRLRRVLESLSPEAAALGEWDDAAAYLTGCSPADSPEQAKAALLDWLQ